MPFIFEEWLKKKRYKESGLNPDYDKHRYSNPPPKRPSEIIEEKQAREDYIRDISRTTQFRDYCKIETYADRKRKHPQSIWDKLLY